MGTEKVAGIEIIASPIETLLSPENASAWIGVRIPFSPASSRNHPTRYFVEAQMAVRQLRKKDPRVADIVERTYQERMDTTLGLLWFSFERSICKEVELDVDYT